MSKRAFEDDRRNGGYGHGHGQGNGHAPQYKKQKQQPHFHSQPQQRNKQHDDHQTSFVKAPSPLPPLPNIKTDAPFRHSSTTGTGRSIAEEDASYEKLEFLGDAYIELWASKLICERLPYLPAGRMSQVREMLVKNETLAVYAKAYKFEDKIQVADMQYMQATAKRANKGFNKVLGDVFEAYVAAVCLADATAGEVTAQQWVKQLWEPALAQLQASDPTMRPPAGTFVIVDAAEPTDPRTTFDPKAKEALQKSLGGKEVKLEYVMDKPSVELKGDQLGQNRHFIALYLTGYGYEKHPLGKGEGRSKTEAGNWAAIEAMYGDAKSVVAECAAKNQEMRDQRKLAKDSQEGNNASEVLKKEAGSTADKKPKNKPKDLLDSLVDHLQPT